MFTVTNVGQAPLENVTYPVTNTGSATWTQDASTCTVTIGSLASCAISGHLTGTNDGAGSLYIKALGSFNGVNYSFVALPLAYTVTAAPSLQITPVSVSMILLANNVDLQSQTYTVKNIGNDPALFTNIALNDSSSNTVKPIQNGGTCSNSTTLNETESCTVIVTYGPAAASQAINESGIATLQVDYHGGTPDTSYNSKATLTYNLVGNDSRAIESANPTINLPGAGTPDSPYEGNANLDPMKIPLTYTNPSVNYPLTNFNLNTNNLPYGLVVDPSSTCKTGSETMNLESGASCTLVLALDRSLLATVGGSVVLDFTTPTATWTTPLGFYSQAGTATYLTYAQPSVVFALSINTANFESTILSITGSNLDKGANPLPVSVAGVSNWLESSPVNPSAGCTVNPSTYAISCSLTQASSTESVTYIMPNYLQTGESADIPLIFSTSAYAYLNPGYTFINYLAPVATGFTNLGNGCTQDNVTGLIWATNGSLLGTGAWGESTTAGTVQYKVAQMNTTSGATGYQLCGYSDWRVPSKDELAAMLQIPIDLSAATPYSDWFNANGFTGVQAYIYWSSSPDASNPAYAWSVDFDFGAVGSDDKTFSGYVWPVRGGQ